MFLISLRVDLWREEGVATLGVQIHVRGICKIWGAVLGRAKAVIILNKEFCFV